MPETPLVPAEVIERRIYLIRRQKVMLDRDLAGLYGVSTSSLNQAVRRNHERFPGDFMFQLDREETAHWKSQIVISNPSLKMGLRRRPLAFTEQGVAMLSSVLRSTRAAQVNIAIMRTFVTLRGLSAGHEELSRELAALEHRYDRSFREIFEAIRQLTTPPDPPRRQIGYGSEE